VEALLDVFKHSNSIISVINKDGKLDFVGPSVQHILGYSSEELTGKRWFEMISFSDDNSRIYYSKTVMKEKFHRPIEHVICDANGKKRYFLFSLSQIDTDKLLVIGQDITPTKENELNILEANKILRLRQQDFTDSVDYAKRIQEAILPNPDRLARLVGNGFVLYKPKDTVSGDFYLFIEANDSSTKLSFFEIFFSK
jgi:PAS domain S-box-containing protein